MDQYIGKMLDDRYEILERIGTGGMAVVYKAKCHYLNRLVAVKILKSDLAQDEDFRRRFNAESQAVAQLSHPNIVSIYDVSKGGDTEYIVMELIDGITLKQYMEKRGQLSWREALHFITQIMRALSHAHSRGIVHRDIKPQNIMVLRDGSVKVADFGIACLENSAQTLTQEALGSVHYISPEQARGDRTDARSDIYSAGVVLYEMLTSRLPFEGDSAVSVAIQHLSSIPLAPREINKDIPEQMELICMKAMAPDLNRRYGSADEMIADLEAFRKNPGVDLEFSMNDLRPEEPDEPTRLLKTAHLSSASGGYRPERQDRYEEPKERRWEEPAPRKSHTGILEGIVVVLALLVALVLFRNIFSSFGQQPNDTYTVPQVLGYTIEQARELEGVKGIFEIQQSGTAPSDKYKVDQIMDQSPSPNAQVKGDLVIYVTVSTGEDTGVMPNLVNEEARNAEKVMLKDLKARYDLDIRTVDEPSDTINSGNVIRTEPEAGETLKKGDTVILYVSSGREFTKVISFVGQDINAVRPYLESSWNLTFGGATTEESDQPAGTILRQSLEAETEVAVNTEISFVISSGPTPDGGERELHFDFELPMDRETVLLRVELNGEVVFEDTVECSQGSYPMDLKGSGTGTVSYYWDGELHASIEAPFS